MWKAAIIAAVAVWLGGVGESDVAWTTGRGALGYEDIVDVDSTAVLGDTVGWRVLVINAAKSEGPSLSRKRWSRDGLEMASQDGDVVKEETKVTALGLGLWVARMDGGGRCRHGDWLDARGTHVRVGQAAAKGQRQVQRSREDRSFRGTYL